ncbi:MAG: PilZ domain-containing protein [Novosphingobium sp.]
MPAKLKLESVSSKHGRPLTRRASRFLAHARVTLRSSHGDRAKGSLRDVSVFGCSVQTAAGWLRTGMFITLGLSGDWTIQAIVRWVRDGRAGVEFLRAISEAEAREIGSD